jgi:hypothetical protein
MQLHISRAEELGLLMEWVMNNVDYVDPNRREVVIT